MVRASKVAATVATTGVLAAIACPVTAVADPAPPAPADPTAPAEPQPDTPGGLPILGYINSNELLLGQYPLPAVGSAQPSAPPDLNALNTSAIQFLLGPNLKLAEQGQDSMYSVGPPDPNALTGDKWEYFRRAHGLWHEVMGKLDPNQLGEPLPGTAPPPGTNIPVGLGQNLPDPQPPALPPAPPAGG
jgi:hypothetical protein